jgi:protein involved in sex pheromone biosynthesis
MKKSLFLVTAGLMLILSGCGPSFDGEWKLSNQREGCPQGFSFLGEDTVTMTPAYTNETVTGTYQEIEDGIYKLDFNVFELPVGVEQTSDDTLTFLINHKTCEYKKAN